MDGKASVFHVQTAGFGIAEQTLDEPALAVGFERVMAVLVCGNDEPFTLLDLFGGEGEPEQWDCSEFRAVA